MKKILILLLCLLLTASITGCGTQSIKPIDTIEGNMKTYSLDSRKHDDEFSSPITKSP